MSDSTLTEVHDGAPETRNVIVLGAGASKQAGAPLMANFLDRADAVRRLGILLDDSDREAFDDVFRLIDALQRVHEKSFIDLDNIEALFGAVEMGELLGQLAGLGQGEVARVRKSLLHLITMTLAHTIRFPIRQRMKAPPPYGKLVEMIRMVGAGEGGRGPRVGLPVVQL